MKGGHGALIMALKNPRLFRSVSAFSPICNPVKCPWGKKAFDGYLGSDEEFWKAYDATELVKRHSGFEMQILIDQGSDDQFLKDRQLLPDNLVIASASNPLIKLEYRLQEGYDHVFVLKLELLVHSVIR